MIVSLICGVVLLTGIIFAFAVIGNIGVLIGLILMGGLLCIIFFSCFIADKSRALIINADQITFPRGAEINGKTVFQKTTIQSKQIRSVEIKFQPGDGVIATVEICTNPWQRCGTTSWCRRPGSPGGS